MPELPEVETIRKQLSKKLPFEISRVETSEVVGSILKTEDFSPQGLVIKKIKRKGKLLEFVLNDDKRILSHLGMSGSWRISNSPTGEKHAHVVLSGPKGYLSYIDPRRFGNMYFVSKLKAQLHLDRLGVDIGSPQFTPEYVYEVLKKFPNKQLKPFLLDQAYFAGSGNYIACEICARAGIRPSRRCGKVTKKECLKIVEGTKSVLTGSLKRNGMTFSGGYVDAFGEKGDGVELLVV